jgi:dephospho-CoA kinase
VLRVALTGNIASGKSAVADVWRRLGAVIVDADDLARAAVEPGGEGLRQVVARFGSRVLRPDGSLHRAALRAIVFDDPEQRAALERILHPEIARLRNQEDRRLADDGNRIVVHMIPLLFETGMESQFDVVVLVDAPEETRLRRIIETRGIGETEARRMIAAQLPAAHKRARADFVIDNSGTLTQLRDAAAGVWRSIAEGAA